MKFRDELILDKTCDIMAISLANNNSNTKNNDNNCYKKKEWKYEKSMKESMKKTKKDKIVWK